MTATAAEVGRQQRIEALARAYPQAIREVTAQHIVLSNGARLVLDDGRAKSHEQKLADADVEDMLSQVYPLGACDTGAPPGHNADPGRIRVTALFTAMYGTSAAAVSANLVAVPWFGSTLRVTRVNGVDKALAAVRDDLARLPKPLHTYFTKTAGVFNWRTIAGTSLLSVHSFGAAIDINIAHANYWRWSGGKPGDVKRYQNKIPREVVRVFEKHGFIWGGHWYHYDTMHFEYRPELIAIGKLAEAAGCK